MAKDIGSYFLEQGQPIVPKAKPKQYTIAKEKSQTAQVLDTLNTKAAVNTLSPRTYVNLVGQIARKAYDQQDISASDYYDIVMPLFGETGEMVTEKIKQYDAELDRYADGGRVNFNEGSPGKKGSNQYTANMRTAEEIQKAINKAPPKIIDGKVYPLTRKDLRGEGKYYKNKIAGRKELERFKDVLKIPSEGKPITKDTRGNQNLKSSQFNKASQGSSISMNKINNFAHFAPKLKSYLTSTQDTGPLKANVNRAAEGYDKKALTIAKEQERLLKDKPKNYKYELTRLNYLAANESKKANEDLAKQKKNLKGTLGYFVVNPNTGEFKLKGVDRAKTFAGISGEKQEYKKMDPSKRVAFGPTQSKVQGIMDLIKSKVKGADIKRASNAPIPPKTLTANMFKGAFKGLPGKSGEIKDPLGGPDLIDIKKLDKNPYNDI
jgi:hypothetical protein